MYWFTKPHPTVYHNASISEVQDLKILEVVKVGLQIWDELQGKDNDVLEAWYWNPEGSY